MNPKVEAYVRNAKQWKEELEALREIILGFPLEEELKWGKPCYSFEGGNVVIMIPLKESCTLAFCKGALLKDTKKILGRPGENTQAGRWIRFTSVREIAKMKAVLKAYVREAIAVEKAGLEVAYKKTEDYPVPEELQKKLKEDAVLRKAFAALTPGRQRGYLLYFAGAKQSATRAARVEKSREAILKGKGWNER